MKVSSFRLWLGFKCQITNATCEEPAPILSLADHIHWPWQEVRTVKVQRFYRPEDISKDLGYQSDFWDIYASAEQEEVEVDVGDIHHKCLVQRSGSPAGWHKHPHVALPLCCASILFL